jgi:hypothetical protein
MGAVQANYMAAQICAVIVNILQAVFKGKGQHPKTISPLDFIPDWGGGDDSHDSKKSTPSKAETVDEMKEFFQQFTRAQSKKKKKKGINEHRRISSKPPG